MSRIEKAIEIAARKRNKANKEQGGAGIADNSTNDKAAHAASVIVSDDRVAGFSSAVSLPPNIKSQNIQSLPTFSNHCLVVTNAPSSPAAEQYRKLKSNILKQVKTGAGKKSFLVTSPMPGEGKSVTSLNLAISLAQEYDHTVLLVEADLRKPSLLQYLDLQAEQGLSDCILNGVDVGSVLVRTGIGGLCILPAGRTVDNPVELFSSKRMQEIADEINNRYPNRIVIFDSTPLLPFAEPQYLAGIVDGIILVVREHLTPIDKLKRSLELLKSHHVLGVVCNGMHQLATIKDYHGYYGNRY